MVQNYKIVIVDDEEDLLDFMEYNLHKNGFDVITTSDSQKALEIIRDEKPHLVILDVMMPIIDGFETCKRIIDMNLQNKPIITFLSANANEYKQIEGLSIGADDYIQKPIKPKLLVSKINSLLRRYQVEDKQDTEVKNNFSLDKFSYEIIHNGTRIQLPKKEFELIEFLYSVAHRVVNRDEILERVWGKDVIVGERTIDVHIKKLRHRIGNDYIRTVKGVGYQFKK